MVFVFRYKVEVHEQGVNMEFRRGDFLVYIELWLVLSPNGTLVRVHGKRRTFYAYGDTVVIKSQVEGLLRSIQEIQGHLGEHDQ